MTQLIKEYIEETKLIAHQITSFNDLILNGLQQVIFRDSNIKLPNDYTIHFGEVYVDYPKRQLTSKNIKKIYPNDARNKQFTYDSNILVNIDIMDQNNIIQQSYNRVSIGKIPIMIGSCRCNLNNFNKIENYECPNDPGGYFIINGKERVLVSQLRPLYNKVYVFLVESNIYCAEIRTMNLSGKSLLIRAKNDNNNNIYLSLPYIKDHLKPGLIFKALGLKFHQLREILHFHDKFVCEIEEQFLQYETEDDAINEVAKSLVDKDRTVVISILQKEMFCHIGHNTPMKSGLHLGYILKKLVETIIGVRVCDDKDTLSNKRLDTANALLIFIFSSLYKQMIKNIINVPSLKKDPKNTPKTPDYLAIIKNNSNITYKLNMCFTSTTWDVQKGATFAKEGVSQIFCRQNYSASISHLRRIMLPVGKKGKILKMRQLSPSHYAFICPYETPEGHQVGTVMNLALTVNVTIEIPFSDVYEVIQLMDTFTNKGDNLVLLNGVIIGKIEDSFEFYKEFNIFRNNNLFDKNISIVRLKCEKEIHIYSDQGRMIRPLFNLKDNKLLYTEGDSWRTACQKNSIVFRDPSEIELSVIAPDIGCLKLNKCDYMEISSSAMMGTMAVVIPFSNNSQSPRLAYQSCMGKQAQGIPSLAFRYRWDTTLNVLNIPQKPLARSQFVNILKFDEMSHGCVPIVAILSYTGFNQEDGFILNKASIDRGLFSSTTYKTITEEAKKRGNSDFESICFPKAEYRKREYNYEHLNSEGVIKNNSILVKRGDVLIGKTITKMIKSDDKRETKTLDISIVVKQNEEGYIDDIYDTVSPEGSRIVKVRIRVPRIPEIGDKFASSCAQKGTCGMIISQEDMPFDKDGVSPDLIMNPHAIPSRMTINMLIEMAYNLIGVKRGDNLKEVFNATAFTKDNIAEELQSYLMEEREDSFSSIMYCGFTGTKMTSRVFMAPSFFQRLKHMVADKFHARRCGPLDTITHQPVAGRAKDGGLKCGEMEKDSMVVHGCSEFLNETLFIKSDKYHIPVCLGCGMIPNNLVSCPFCSSKIETKNMPYAAKLLFQQFMGMGIKIKIA